MQRRHGPLVSLRRVLTATLAALVLGGAGTGLASAGPALADAGPTLYGQVVDVGPSAIVLSLENTNVWVALNVTAQTVIASQSGGPATISGIAPNDWALVAYTVTRAEQNKAVATWLVARTITYSTSPVSTGGQAVHVTGRVTAVAESGFTVRANNGAVWSVSVTDTTSVLLGETAATLSLLQVGDVVQVWGTAAGNFIVATRVAYRVASAVAHRKGRARP